MTRVGTAPEILLAEAFTSSDGWSFTGPATAQWHITEDGECGAVGAMLGFTLPQSDCNVAAAGVVTATAASAEFVLTGTWPYRLTFDQIRDIGDAYNHDATAIRIVDQSGEYPAQVIGDAEMHHGVEPGVLTHMELEIPNGSKLVGRTVRLEFVVTQKQNSILPGKGWMIDNVVLRNDGEDWGLR